MYDISTSIINTVDELVSQTYISLFKERPALLTFLFHGLFNDRKEIALNLVHPQQEVTTDIFRQFIEYYLEHNYLFISPQDIVNGLRPNRNYVLITFDDGYYSNHLALPVLKEYQVPATFFISTNHIIENKCFWWDIIYRERLGRGTPAEKVNNEIMMLKQKKNDEIEQYITATFGRQALEPVGDIDRPFTPSELNAFSKESLVVLGNHTHNHAILTNYSSSEIRSEILAAQETLFNLTGIQPVMISYPNGNYSDEVLAISQEIGFKLGITVNQRKNHLPIELQGVGRLLLNRYVVWGNRDIRQQCARFRSDIQLKSTLKSLMK